ncbi:hypothetical protein EC991_007797 [Linnemannia zychae]|nr:hypothetical protein EC991_007797 [Linnemannia zychae]
MSGGRSALPSPEDIFNADMNDLTDIRKSSHQTYTPTMRRWKDFCERHRTEYEGPDGRKLYLVNSEDKVRRFLEEEVLIRGKSKRVKPNSGSSAAEGFLEVTVGPDVVKMARSALGRIHRLQLGRKEVDPVAPSDMKVFHEKIAQSIKAMSEREDAGYGKSREHYSVENLIKALDVLWEGSDARKEPGQNLMDMFFISATHNLLLRDEELLNINFSDCFAVISDQNRQEGAQQLVALTFRLKTNNPTSDSKLYVSALRHHDVSRCTFSAFAFYMFQIWQGTMDSDPWQGRTLDDVFQDLGMRTWSSFKLLPGATDPTESSPPHTFWNAIHKTFKSMNVSLPRKVDGGRYVGAIEAQKLKIPTSDIVDGGRWSVERGKHGECQVPQLRTVVPAGMAGFLDKPYALARNKVSPPIPLQMLIFPWIEFAFGVNNEWWKQECQNEMNEVLRDQEVAPSRASKRNGREGTDGSKATNGVGRRPKGKHVNRHGRDAEDSDYKPRSARHATSYHDGEAESDADAESVSSVREASNSAEYDNEEEIESAPNARLSPPVAFSEAEKAKAGFLRLLVRCRRIILQDAAMRFHRHQPNKILDHNVFRNTMFKNFQEKLGAAADKEAALSRKHPRQKSPSASVPQFRPIHAVGAQPPTQHRQQQQDVVIDLEAPSTTGHHHQPPPQRSEVLSRSGSEKPYAPPAPGLDQPQQQQHHLPRSEAPSPRRSEVPSPSHSEAPPSRSESSLPPRSEAPPHRSEVPPPLRSEVLAPPRSEVPPPSQSPTYAALEQQMLQMQHTIQMWGQHQETQMQQMYAQHMKIHEMQQQMITTMMAALRTQQTQAQPQWPTVYPPPASGSSLTPPVAYQQPSDTSLHRTSGVAGAGTGTVTRTLHSSSYSTTAATVASTNSANTASSAPQLTRLASKDQQRTTFVSYRSKK